MVQEAQLVPDSTRAVSGYAIAPNASLMRHAPGQYGVRVLAQVKTNIPEPTCGSDVSFV
jgi:hypothetical protein